MSMQEVAPGIHRIESDLGSRFMAQYLLIGAQRTVLVDTGLAQTPDTALVPALEEAGLEPDLILISHADLDHCGGNRTMRQRYPRTLLACHERDRGQPGDACRELPLARVLRARRRRRGRTA
jgi:glyoxylase-like metal-dependent hydrolase (beta-lactamase superfamily II)